MSWEALQSAFMQQLLRFTHDATGSAPEHHFAGWRGFGAREEVQDAPAEPGPWASFRLFVETLIAYGDWLKSSRRRPVPVAAALDRMLGDVLNGLEAALSARDALQATPWPELPMWPVFGLTREWQKLGGELAQAMAAERKATDKLQRLQWLALVDGINRLRASLNDEQSEARIDSLQGLYDHFIAHLEDAYQDSLRTDAFVVAFGERANAGLRVRDAFRALGCKALPVFGLPSAADLTEIGRRLAALELSAAPPSTAFPVVDEQTATPAKNPAKNPRRASKKSPSTTKPAKVIQSTPKATASPRTAPKKLSFDIDSISGGRRPKS
jgi:hypothetical protein